jgi:hypothetical protein
MNPPINRENLIDVLIALVVAIGLAWVVTAFEGWAANSPPPLAAMATQLLSSQKA